MYSHRMAWYVFSTWSNSSLNGFPHPHIKSSCNKRSHSSLGVCGSIWRPVDLKNAWRKTLQLICVAGMCTIPPQCGHVVKMSCVAVGAVGAVSRSEPEPPSDSCLSKFLSVFLSELLSEFLSEFLSTLFDMFLFFGTPSLFFSQQPPNSYAMPRAILANVAR